jgi:YesN/AraC family two-component response regulator
VAVKAGVSNYIIKPFNPETLKTKIDKIFGK